MKNFDYVVSFCIPTYNRADTIYRVVTQILSSTEPRVQVVVSDNGSTDNTWDKLLSITDSRLKVCKNPYPDIPPQLNWLNALNQGDGNWLYLVMGRDLILAANIPQLIRHLEAAERKGVAFVYENLGNSGGSYRYYTKKADALKRFMALFHPTGNIFRKDVFTTIPNKERACMIIDDYPENYFKSKIIENWNCIELPSIVNKKTGWGWGKSIPRSTFDPDPDSVHFFPNRRIKPMIQMMDLVRRHSLSIAEHDTVFIGLWKMLMYYVSDQFKILCAEKRRCIHYGLSTREVTKKEMLQNIFQAYREVNRHYPNMRFQRKRMMLTAMLDKICEILLNPYYSRLRTKLMAWWK